MEWNVQLAWLSLWLTVWTISDIKRRAVRLWQTLLVLGVGILWQWTAGQLITWNVAGGMLIGGLAWGFSCLSAERLGKGDAVLLCMGVYLGFAALLAVLMQALFFGFCGCRVFIADPQKDSAVGDSFCAVFGSWIYVFYADRLTA